ncbi:response regulator transcription factor [Amycolatopsis sp. cmx-11-12]|uniref:response regulator transcription factor n=1 Tax=Amycolatopsis sp. cmx-11-12 TaxID=2785795 RepID=UPI0039184313
MYESTISRTASRISGGQSTTGQAITVAAVEQDPLFCDGIRAIASRVDGLHWVGAASDPSTAMTLCKKRLPNILLVNSTLDPRAQLTHTLLRRKEIHTAIALVSKTDETARYILRAAQQGTSGFVARSVTAEQLAHAIKTCYVAGRYIAPDLRHLLTQTIPPQVTKQAYSLSGRENEVLHLLSNGAETRDIAISLHISIETVRTHVKNILHKLGAHNRAHAVTVAHKAGLLGGREPHASV